MFLQHMIHGAPISSSVGFQPKNDQVEKGQASNMENTKVQVWVYTLLERPSSSEHLCYHIFFALAFLLAIGFSVLQTTGQ